MFSMMSCPSDFNRSPVRPPNSTSGPARKLKDEQRVNRAAHDEQVQEEPEQDLAVEGEAHQKIQVPRSKFQRSARIQAPRFCPDQRHRLSLELGVWSFSGSWILNPGSFHSGLMNM